ncbi:hypothetical protein D3P07_03125 [Paenibacillus sp. 1011MAR3C5]|uniref:hypothetical protein n=1 Tax=Paenibacillus sp. 1011MAR3C5 TaxID=1675787 RepID=UPI000E6C25AB|nr:hypothetical protein [Paenibacillus sp. 1011MAR3C5]RJE91428.1 hypothetical protein D3P07_03125 [Paenibacillus sp. 1011MAR3C5]
MDEHRHEERFEGSKTFYVSVQAGQLLEEQGAAAYELEIHANAEQVNLLRELFEELSSMDEAQTFQFAGSPFSPNSDEALNSAYDDIISRIYRQLHECGTSETKSHIESMGLF